MRLTTYLLVLSHFTLGLSVPTVRSELLLDDFDVPAEALSPEMLNESVTTLNVGDFDSSRSMEISAVYSSSPPTGFLAANRDSNSQLRAEVNYAPRPSVSSFRDVRSVLAYEFAEVDATDGGQNDAILFDFEQLVATAATLTLLMFVQDDFSGRFNVNLTDFPSRYAPFQLTIPFTEFRAVGGMEVNFEKLRRVSFILFANPPQDSMTELHVTMALNSIRFGRIPEPTVVFLALLGGLAHIGFLRRVCR